MKPEIIARLTDHQYAALLSFVFNLGAGPKWTIWKSLNAGAFDQVPTQIMRFNKARVGGVLKTLPGLTNRRAAEVQLWNTPDEDLPEVAIEQAIPLDSAPLPPSSETRRVETPPAPMPVKPLATSKTFLAQCATAAAACAGAAGVAVEQAKTGVDVVSRTIRPFAEQSAAVGEWLEYAAMAGAGLALLAVALSVIKQRGARL